MAKAEKSLSIKSLSPEDQQRVGIFCDLIATGLYRAKQKEAKAVEKRQASRVFEVNTPGWERPASI